MEFFLCFAIIIIIIIIVLKLLIDSESLSRCDLLIKTI